jgi:hypothetical protein
VFPAGDVLVVKSAEDPLSPPSVQRSEFSSDGSKIKVAFTSPTNRGGVANVISCESLFKPSSPLSHPHPLCGKWRTPSRSAVGAV